ARHRECKAEELRLLGRRRVRWKGECQQALMLPSGGRVRPGHDGEVRGTARATAPGCAHRMLTGSRGWARLPWLPSPRMGLRRYSAKISRQLQPLWRRWLTLGGKLRTARQGFDSLQAHHLAPAYFLWRSAGTSVLL